MINVNNGRGCDTVGSILCNNNYVESIVCSDNTVLYVSGVRRRSSGRRRPSGPGARAIRSAGDAY